MPKIMMAVAAVLGAVFLAFSLLGGAERTPPRPPRPVQEEKAKPVWRESALFNGQAPGQTASFTIARGPWRLRWEADGQPTSSSLGFTVFNENQALPPVVEKNGLKVPDGGTLTFKQSGVFYILVSSYEANWRFTVESQNP